MNVIRIDKTLVAYIKGKQYAKEIEGSSDELLSTYESLLNSTEEEALKFFKAPETTHETQLRIEFEAKKEEAKKFEDILDFMKDVRDNGHDLFEVKNNSIYLKGINISMPELLVREIIKASNNLDISILEGDLDAENESANRLNALINFWSLCAMNPDPRARHDLFKFLQKGKFTITNSGYFVAYRNANIKNRGNIELQKFVTQEWMKVKRWKKAPKAYGVIKTSEGYIISKKLPNEDSRGEDLGNLDELYQDISNVSETVYTDAHTGSMTIKIGEPVRINRADCDADPMRSCSSGLHCASTEFLGQGGAFGNTGLVVLINPKNVVAVPEDYLWGKMRVCEYLPISVAERDEKGYIIPVDTSDFEVEMTENTQEELQLMSEMSSTELEEYKKHEFIAPELDFESVRNIKDNIDLSLEEANEIVNNRKI